MAGIRWKGLKQSKHWQRSQGASRVPEDGPKKPEFGKSCNGCGVCCVAEPCAIAQLLIPGVGSKGPCPALEWRDGRSWCGMTIRPAYYSSKVRQGPCNEAEAARMIREDLGGVGGSCDSSPRDGPDAFVGLTAAQYLRAV
jgi:hypothetical protein